MFGLTVIFSGLEWDFRVRWFGFLSRPLGKGLYVFFIAVYFMGAGKDDADDWNRTETTLVELESDDEWTLKENTSFIAGALLAGMAVCYLSCFLGPCMGRCCTDRANYYAQTNAEREAGYAGAGVAGHSREVTGGRTAHHAPNQRFAKDDSAREGAQEETV